MQSALDHVDRGYKPDMVINDISMPGKFSLAAATQSIPNQRIHGLGVGPADLRDLPCPPLMA